MSDTENNHSDGKSAANAIEVRDLHKRFGHQQVLDGLTLDFPAGKITTIVGPSGVRQNRPAQASQPADAP